MVFAKNFARFYGKKNTWNIRRLVNESFVPRPREPAYYIVDCRISCREQDQVNNFGHFIAPL